MRTPKTTVATIPMRGNEEPTAPIRSPYGPATIPMRGNEVSRRIGFTESSRGYDPHEG